MEPTFLMLAVLPSLHPHPQPFAGLRVWCFQNRFMPFISNSIGHLLCAGTVAEVGVPGDKTDRNPCPCEEGGCKPCTKETNYLFSRGQGVLWREGGRAGKGSGGQAWEGGRYGLQP